MSLNNNTINLKNNKNIFLSNFLINNIFNNKYINPSLKNFNSLHLVTISPWPFFAGISLFSLLTNSISYFHKYNYSLIFVLFSLFSLIIILYNWFEDIIIESYYQGYHSLRVQEGLKLGFLLFLGTEILFFFGFFWAFFHSSLVPVISIGSIWPPKGIQPIETFNIPLLNTIILLCSGFTCTWSHHALFSLNKKNALIGIEITLILAFYFILLQTIEFNECSFSIADSIFGSCFFMLCGFHGFHVIIGTIFIFINWIRMNLTNFSNSHHIGFLSAIYYWHMVDVVWIFLFFNVYFWGSL
jgi:cytochrome c oxidase subunit 3